MNGPKKIQPQAASNKLQAIQLVAFGLQLTAANFYPF